AVPVAAPQQVTDRLPGPLPGLVLAHHPGHMYRTRVPGHTPKTTPGPAIPIPESWLQDQAACSPYRLVNHRIPCQNARNFGLAVRRLAAAPPGAVPERGVTQGRRIDGPVQRAAAAFGPGRRW